MSSPTIEHLVDLSTCVALSPPERSQDRERGRSLNGRGELPGRYAELNGDELADTVEPYERDKLVRAEPKHDRR